jgi:2-amino-4-hydroxy-6-hydroxymethyldihydropteridine diphosphokinase
MTVYFVSLGSNIAPYQNMVRMVRALLEISAEIDVSRVIVTAPNGIDSDRPFLNACVRLHSELDATTLKTRFNAIEAQLGRDRSDPGRSYKDRPADLDIICALPDDALVYPRNLLPTEPYVQPLLIELLGYLGMAGAVRGKPLLAGIKLDLNGQIFGRYATTLAAERIKVEG